MPAYIILDVDIHDGERYEEYKRLGAPTLAEFGGKFLCRGGEHDVLEGDWVPHRIVVLEFPSMERARAWWASDRYAPARMLRQEIATSNMIVVDGV